MRLRGPAIAVALGAILLLAPVVGAVVPFQPMAASAPAQDGTQADTAVEPGARLSGVVGAENASLAGELQRTAFKVKLETAGSNQAKASVVASEATAIQNQLDKLRERQAELTAAHENGSISDAAYVAQASAIAASIQALEARANQTAKAARGLPAELLESKGINVTAIERLRTDARNLTGQEVADIARTIAGDRGQGGPPDDVGPGQDGNVTTAINTTADRLDRVSDRLNKSAASLDNETMSQARSHLTKARSDLQEARTLASGNPEQAQSLVESAVEEIEAAAALLGSENGAGPDDGTETPTGGPDDNPGQGP